MNLKVEKKECGGWGRKTGTEMCHVHILILYSECNHYVLQKCTNKSKIKNKLSK